MFAGQTFINKQKSLSANEKKFKTLEKERPDALEMAAQENEEGEEKERG